MVAPRESMRSVVPLMTPSRRGILPLSGTLFPLWGSPSRALACGLPILPSSAKRSSRAARIEKSGSSPASTASAPLGAHGPVWDISTPDPPRRARRFGHPARQHGTGHAHRLSTVHDCSGTPARNPPLLARTDQNLDMRNWRDFHRREANYIPLKNSTFFAIEIAFSPRITIFAL
jgi:hypothetical protein